MVSIKVVKNFVNNPIFWMKCYNVTHRFLELAIRLMNFVGRQTFYMNLIEVVTFDDINRKRINTIVIYLAYISTYILDCSHFNTQLEFGCFLYQKNCKLLSLFFFDFV